MGRRGCLHLRTRCIHGDEIVMAMKTFLFRWWKGPVIYRQVCLDCNASLERLAICTLHPGQHTWIGRWNEPDSQK